MKIDEKIIDKIFENWPSPVITRDQLPEVTGGMVNIKTLRNEDSLNKGIDGKFAINSRKIAYPTCCVIEYLKEKIRKHNA